MGFVCFLLWLYSLVIFARIIMSWIRVEPGTGVAQVHDALVSVTEPVLGPVRRAIPPARMGMMALDLSPIVVGIGIVVLQRILCG